VARSGPPPFSPTTTTLSVRSAADAESALPRYEAYGSAYSNSVSAETRGRPAPATAADLRFRRPFVHLSTKTCTIDPQRRVGLDTVRSLSTDRTVVRDSDDATRRLMELACHRRTWPLLAEAVDNPPLTRDVAAARTNVTAQTADVALRRLLGADLLLRGRGERNTVVFEATALGRDVVASVRSLGARLPPPDRGWIVALRRGRHSDWREVDRILSSRTVRTLRCSGDFDLLVALVGDVPAAVEDLRADLRDANVADIAVLRLERNDR
jgi:hypothetical protein